MKTLTKTQKRDYEILIRLGDSKELALKTVLAEKSKGTEMYQIAYYS